MAEAEARERFLELLAQAVGGGTLAKLTLGRYRGAEPGLRNLHVRAVTLKAGPHLSFIWRHHDRDLTRNHPPAEALKLLAGIGDTDVVPNEGALVEVSAATGHTVPLTLIPPVIAHSGATISIPEYSAVRGRTDVPVAVHGARGKGRTVYFANAMDALFYHYGFPDLGRILANAVRHGLGDAHVLEVDAPDFVDVTLQAQAGRKLVHLINFPVAKPLSTGWRHPGRTLVPLRDIAVRYRLAAGEKVREARLASNEEKLQVTLRDGWAEFKVPQLDDHEIVIVELA